MPKPDHVELKTKIGVSEDNVVIIFDEKINWLSLSPSSAREFAAGIIEAADIAGKNLKLN